MKIYTLGTSHGNATRSRFHSSTAYVTEDGSLYLLDAGAPVDALLLRAGLSCNRIRAILLTHMHEDHTGGLTALAVQINKYASERPYPAVAFFPDPKAIEPFRALFAAQEGPRDNGQLVFHRVTDGVVYEDENLVATAIRTRHLVSPNDGISYSFAYDLLFKKEGKRILHTGDLSHAFTDFPAVASEEHFDACLCEATHYRPEDAHGILSAARLSRLIFVHIGERWHTTDGSRPTVGEGEAALLSYAAAYPYPVSVAHDGDVFTV